MSSNKFSNPWMPASNGVFGGGSDYNNNAYSVRGRGAANNPWVQGSGWWENSVEGNYQKGFGQATQSNEYYSTEPVSLQAMRRMRTITVLVAGGALVGAAAAAGLFSGGGGAAVAAGGTAATTTGGGGTLLGSGTLFAGGGIGATGLTTAQALGTAGSVLGGVVGNSLMSSQGASALQGSSGMGNGGNNGPGGNASMNSLGNALHPGWPPAQPPGNPQPKTQTKNRGRRRKEESEGEMPDDPTFDLMEQMYRDTMRGYGMRYGGNGSYAKTTGSNGYAHKQNTHPNQNQRPDGDSNEDYTIKRTGRSTDGLREYEVNETLEIIEKRPAHLNNQPSNQLEKLPWLAPEGFGQSGNPWLNRAIPAAGIFAGTTATLQYPDWPYNWPSPYNNSLEADEFFTKIQFSAIYNALLELGFQSEDILRDLRPNNRYGAILNNPSKYIKNWESEKFDSVSKEFTAFESSSLNLSGYSLKFYPDRGNMIGIIQSIEFLHWAEAFNEKLEYWGNTGTIPFNKPSFMHEENAVRYLLQRTIK